MKRKRMEKSRKKQNGKRKKRKKRKEEGSALSFEEISHQEQ